MLEAVVVGMADVVSEAWCLSPVGAMVGNRLLAVDGLGPAVGNKGACDCSEGLFRKSKTPPEP